MRMSGFLGLQRTFGVQAPGHSCHFDFLLFKGWFLIYVGQSWFQSRHLGLAISRSIFISREREFPKHFGYFPGISRELKTYLIANRKYPIFERKCIFWGSRIILSFVTIIFDSKVWFWAQRKISKIEWNRKICQSQYIKISRNFPGNRKNSRDQAGLKIFGKFPRFPGR